MFVGISSLLRRDFFFFSSRRRHTRCGRDWSSDVCSSDLPGPRPRCIPWVVPPVQLWLCVAPGPSQGQEWPSPGDRPPRPRGPVASISFRDNPPVDSDPPGVALPRQKKGAAPKGCPSVSRYCDQSDDDPVLRSDQLVWRPAAQTADACLAVKRVDVSRVCRSVVQLPTVDSTLGTDDLSRHAFTPLRWNSLT